MLEELVIDDINDIGLLYNDGEMQFAVGTTEFAPQQSPSICAFCGALLDVEKFGKYIGLTCSCDGWIEFEKEFLEGN